MSSPSPMSQFCVGTLVASKYVLTSAQCADDKDPSDLHLMIGDHDLGASGETPLNEKRLSVQKIIIHESYHPNTKAYDIALLETDPVDLGVYTPACLASDMYGHTFDGKVAQVTSWDSASMMLVTMDAPVVSNINCSDNMNLTITPGMVCAEIQMGVDEKEDPCKTKVGYLMVLIKSIEDFTQLTQFKYCQCLLSGPEGKFNDF